MVIILLATISILATYGNLPVVKVEDTFGSTFKPLVLDSVALLCCDLNVKELWGFSCDVTVGVKVEGVNTGVVLDIEGVTEGLELTVEIGTTKVLEAI